MSTLVAAQERLRREGQAMNSSVAIASSGRFHLHDAAREVLQKGRSCTLYTAYPGWKLQQELRPHARTFPWFMTPAMFFGRLGMHGMQHLADALMFMTFDQWVKRALQPCGILHALSTCGLAAYEIARARYGASVICDRGSTHILYQDSVLRAEFERHGQPYQGIPQRVIARELAEYEQADAVLVPSSFVAATFVKNGLPPHKVHRIGYGVDLQMFNPRKRVDDRFRLLFVGAISLRKGVPYLLEAIQLLKHLDIELWLIGSLLPEMKDMLRRSNCKVTYLGVKKRSELAFYYSNASLLVLPSLEEGLALVQLQALACGLPVMSTRAAGADDILTEGVNGYIVAERCPEAIADRTLRLYTNRERLSEMSRQARQSVAAKAGWSNYGRQLIALYDKLTSRRAETA